MRTLALLVACMCVSAASALAVGIDLTFDACGNNSGATNAATIDCAAGATVTLLAVFQPAEAYDDSANGYVLVGIDGALDMQVAGLLSPIGSAAFWDWDLIDGCSPATYPPGNSVFSMSRIAPTTGCAGYLDTFNIAGSGERSAAARRSQSVQRVAFYCFRPASSPLSTYANQKLFAAQLLIDGSKSLESGGGTCGGCPVSAGIVWSLASPVVLNGGPTTALIAPSLAGNCVGVNNGFLLCRGVPAKRHTWGQLKSLYR